MDYCYHNFFRDKKRKIENIIFLITLGNGKIITFVNCENDLF
jgi:hypothetical protein